MLYAILCYDNEETIGSWSREQDQSVMTRLAAVQSDLAAVGKLGPVARLLPTTSATTVRKGKESIIIDGPFAETKEQLLGFFVIDAASLDEALEITGRLREANDAVGAYEVRPIAYFEPGSGVT